MTGRARRPARGLLPIFVPVDALYHQLVRTRRRSRGPRATAWAWRSNSERAGAAMRHSPMRVTMGYNANVDDALRDAMNERA